jgi:hypothetical protein
MNSKITFRIIGGLLTLLFLIGCNTSTQAPNPTLTFTQGKCTYSGPQTNSAAAFMVSLVLANKNTPESGFALVTLSSGKTIADLKAWPSTDPPAWLTDIDDEGYISKDTNFPYDLTKYSYWHQGEPLYLVCFQLDSKATVQKIGAFGPINVK